MVNFLISLKDNDPLFRQKELKAQTMLNVIWNSEEFKDEILNFTHTETEGKLWWKKEIKVKGFTSTEDSNERVYEKLMSKFIVHIIQNIVVCDNPKVIGYELDGDETTYVCKGWDKELDEYGVSDNGSHELCHQLGYWHASASDYDSVPYAVGYIVEKLAKRMFPVMSQVEVALESASVEPSPQ